MIEVTPSTIELGVGQTQRFTFSGKTGAEYFVDVPVGAGLCTLTKISATEWDLTRTANGSIILRGSENPWTLGTIDSTDGLTTLRADGRRQILANFSYQYFTTPLTGDGHHKIKVGFSNQRIFWSGQFGSYQLFDINNGGSTAAIGDEVKFERNGSNIKYYKNSILIDTQVNPYPGFNGALVAGMESDGIGSGYINRPEISGITSGYSEAIATINIPTPPADMVLSGAEVIDSSTIAINFSEALEFDKIKIQRCENPSFAGSTFVEYDNQNPASPFLNNSGLSSTDYKFYFYRAKAKKSNGLYSDNWSNIVFVAWNFPKTFSFNSNIPSYIFEGLKGLTAYKIRGRVKIDGEWSEMTDWEEISTE